MGTHVIQSVKAVPGIVDRLRWQVRISTNFGAMQTGPIFLARWEGVVAFYLDESMGTSFMQGGPPFCLIAVWTNRERTCRVQRPDEATFEFETALPGDAFDRIERLRDGGRLFARIEGHLLPIYRDSGGEDSKPWLDSVVRTFSQVMTRHEEHVISLHLELTHHVWCEEILATLRPPGRYVFDVQLPKAVAGGDPAGHRAIKALENARKLYDQAGLPSAIAGAVYVALDEAKGLFGPFEQRYGSFGAARLEEQRKELAGMCNPDRHARREHHDGLEFDQRLALHAVVSASSILSCLLR